MFSQVLFSSEQHTGKLVFSHVIKIVIILFPSLNFTQFSAYVSVGKEKAFNENFEDRSIWKIIGITDSLPAIPLRM